MSQDIAVDVIATKILAVRGKKVMVDKVLAKLYGVSVKVLNQSVRRNSRRFPDDFMFQLSWEEVESLKPQILAQDSRSQFVTLKQGRNIKYLPYVFTEQGVAMLSSVLNSETAIQVNILIMRAFTRINKILLTHKEFQERIKALENKYAGHDQSIQQIFEAIKQLLEPERVEERRITGFKPAEGRQSRRG